MICICNLQFVDYASAAIVYIYHDNVNVVLLVGLPDQNLLLMTMKHPYGIPFDATNEKRNENTFHGRDIIP